MEFEPFPKIARIARDMIVTEKIDGTNAQVVVLDDGQVLAGSRNRYITPEDDNFGFARWVAEHEAELRDGLGVGRHYGEWWGSGIGRRYDLKEKRFSLFNVRRWGADRPACCHVVPVLYEGPFATGVVDLYIEMLRKEGSAAAPGFMRPEGVVVFHVAGGYLFKKTLEKDEEPKSRGGMS
jgi:hypothetical protein